MLLVPILTSLAAGLAAIGAVLVARRERSGSVKTTRAEKLWDEATDIRDAMHDEIDDLRRRCTALERRAEAAEAAHRQCQIELDGLRREMASLRRTA